MENASKALLIAGGVLIAMVVASFGVYLYSVYHEHSERMLERMSEKEMSEFNAKFLAFEDRDLTANEVVSIMNLVRNNNIIMTGDVYQVEISWGNSGTGFDFNGVMHQFDNLNGMTEDNYHRNCLDFINNYSEYTTVEDTTGNPIMGYVYVFTCKVINYENGTVKRIKVDGRKNKIVPP